MFSILPAQATAPMQAADIAIGLGCIAIPPALGILLRRRQDWPFRGLLAVLCAATAIIGASLLLRAWPGQQSLPVTQAMQAVAAVAMFVAAASLWIALPGLLALPSSAMMTRELDERRAAEARLEAVIANLSDALFVLRVGQDGALLVETANPAFERTFGLVTAGEGVESVLPEAVLRDALPLWRQAAAEGRTIEYESEADLPTGRRIWHTVLVPMRGQDGAVERLLGTARDLTATRRLQAGLVQSARLATVGSMCAGLASCASP